MLSWVFMVCGLFFVITSTFGILRFTEFFNKFHPAGILDALGMPLIMIGLICKSGFSLVSLKIVLIVLAIWVTSSTASYVIARAYYKRNKKL